MAQSILLDAGLLGLACSPPSNSDRILFTTWLRTVIHRGDDIYISDLTRFEVRRELLRLRATTKLRRLDEFAEQQVTLTVTSEAWERAADFWAIVRQAGRPTASPDSLDADAILAGVAATIARPDDQVIIATTNVRHLSWFPGIDARRWVDIL